MNATSRPGPPPPLYAGFTEEVLRGGAPGFPTSAHRVIVALLDIVQASSAHETLQRLRRVETKIHKIALAVNADTDPATTMTAVEDGGNITVYVPGYDVTLAQVRRALEQADLRPDGYVYLMQDNALLGTLRLTDRR